MASRKTDSKPQQRLSPRDDAGKHEKLIFKFSFANKNHADHSPTRAISVSASSSCECQSKSEGTNEEIEQLGTPVKLDNSEPTYQNDPLETPKNEFLGAHPYAQAM